MNYDINWASKSGCNSGVFKRIYATSLELKQAQTFYKEYLEYRDDKKPGDEYEMLLYWAEDLKVDRYSELVSEIQYRKRSDINFFINSLEKDPLGLDERDLVQMKELLNLIWYNTE